MTFDKALICVIFLYYTTTFWCFASIANYAHKFIQFMYIICAPYTINILGYIGYISFYPLLLSGLTLINIAKLLRIVVADILFMNWLLSWFINKFYLNKTTQMKQRVKILTLHIILINFITILYLLSIQTSMCVIIVGLVSMIWYNQCNIGFIMGIHVQHFGLLAGIPWILGWSTNIYYKLICVICVMIATALQFGIF